MTHDHAKDLCSSELGLLCTWYVECILECMLEHAVLATEQLGLTRCSEGSSPTIHLSLITFIETHSCHRILRDQPGHLLFDHQHPVDQPARLLGQDNMITVVPSTPVAPRTCTKQPGGLHAGCVALKRTGTGKARQVDSGLGN